MIINMIMTIIIDIMLNMSIGNRSLEGTLRRSCQKKLDRLLMSTWKQRPAPIEPGFSLGSLQAAGGPAISHTVLDTWPTLLSQDWATWCILQLDILGHDYWIMILNIGMLWLFLLPHIDQWEFQDPKLEVLCHIRSYKAIFLGDIPLHRPYIGLIYGRYLHLGSWNGHWIEDVSKPAGANIRGSKPQPVEDVVILGFPNSISWLTELILELITFMFCLMLWLPRACFWLTVKYPIASTLRAAPWQANLVAKKKEAVLKVPCSDWQIATGAPAKLGMSMIYIYILHTYIMYTIRVPFVLYVV